MNTETATLGGGCFWCLQPLYEELRGVIKVEVGYSGGRVANPAYEDVSSGRTGHAEVVQITFNPEEVSFEDLLNVFFFTHDPTTLNRQGNDIGPQYRSIIFTHDSEQDRVAREALEKLAEQRIWEDPIVTEIVPFSAFFPAEEYHQQYYEKNPDLPYCRIVIDPKISKFRKQFLDKLKKEAA